MVCVKGETVGMFTGPPLHGLPELFRPETVCEGDDLHSPSCEMLPGFSDMNGLGAAANRSLLLSEQELLSLNFIDS